VHALAVYDGELIAGGSFHYSGAQSFENVARWNGTIWQPLGPGIPSAVGSLGTSSSDLIAASSGSLDRWNGSAWQPLATIEYSASVILAHGPSLFVGGDFSVIDGIASPFLAGYGSPTPSLALAQPGGPGAGVQVTNDWLIPGHEYYNLASLNPCAGGPGTGPYGGLCYTNVADLIGQLTLPIGAAPFHFVAGSPDASFGPFPLPPGLAIEALAVDVTGGTLGCLSRVTSYLVN
jgi:hypothetical protein